MNELTIALTSDEQALVAQINFDALSLRRQDDVRRNGAVVAALMRSLAIRKGIPEARVRYFNDPEYFVGGRGSSRRQIFERNGTRGEEIFNHPHFLEYLRYFLCGPSLPCQVIEAFRDEVAHCGTVTSGDVIPLGRRARELARSCQPDPSWVAEEFYKLALDCGLWVSYAQSVRNAVKQARPTRR
ncbi:MAG: hypothetical protein KIT81_06190 [Alphaproteobacteria bacterium]|nr:hypothetical protein [Alphaproteobacteria bacterium]